MSHFTSPPRIEQIGPELFQVIEPFSFICSVTGITTDVPRGFNTDLTSNPRLTRSVIGKIGYWTPGTIVHDRRFFLHRTGQDKIITQLQSDDILMEACTVMANIWEVPEHERWPTLALYGAVRAFGVESWETPSEKKERLAKLKLPEHILDQ